MEDCYSEGREFEPVSGALSFVGMKIPNQLHAACCSWALLATLIRFIFLCVFGDWKLLILYIERASSNMGQIFFCMF